MIMIKGIRFKVPWILLIIVLGAGGSDLPDPINFNLKNEMRDKECPNLKPEVFPGVPMARHDEGIADYKRFPEAKTLEQCVGSCCKALTNCQVAFISVNDTVVTCFHVHCKGVDRNCLPKKAQNLPDKISSYVVLVRPLKHSSWDQVIGSVSLTVSVVSKNITLPDNRATLTAYAIPEGKYEYEWSLTSDSHNEDGTMETKNKQVLKLTNLKEGIYEFKVVVKGEHPPAHGEGQGYIHVERERIKSPPKAKVVPVQQTISLPETKAIIDGSVSSDDKPDKLVYKWDLKQQPVHYKSKDLDKEHGSLLMLNDLVVGNYTVELTVEDSDGSKDTALGHISVVEEVDHPPTANAGEVKVIYLPQNTVTLYGNGSSDDHGIVSYEWTRSGPSATLAADMRDSRAPILHLSNLEEGTYEFKLTVKDVKDQANAATVHVFVKPPTNAPPTSVAGDPSEINLPVNWVKLDGFGSHDDVNITSWEWTQVSGPNQANIINGSKPIANATGLTKGEYVFSLRVGDEPGNFDDSQVKVVVKQDTNAPPVANAGQDMLITLPQSVIPVYGNASKDDLRIAKWQWSRLPESLAAGKIIGNSSQESILLLSDVVPGQYLFQLQVWDDQGKSSTDTVSINVHESPYRSDVVEAVLNEQITALTATRLQHLCESLTLLMGEDHIVEVWEIYIQPHTGNAVIQFVIRGTKDGKSTVIKGVEVVDTLKRQLVVGQDVLKLQLLQLDTLVCQNECSGHGSCHQATRECICEPFWIENFVRRHLMDGERNCEWSVIYLGIFLSMMAFGIICGTAYTFCKKRREKGGIRNRNKRRTMYKRLNQTEPGIELRNAHTSRLMMSDSEDSESDEIIFDDELKRRPRRNGGTNTPSSSDALSSSTRANGTLKSRLA